MCFWVEKAEVRKLIGGVRTRLERLRKIPRASDLLFDLPQAVILPAIVFRDFPKSHGNIIQEAVDLALRSHPGGYVATSACPHRDRSNPIGHRRSGLDLHVRTLDVSRTSGASWTRALSTTAPLLTSGREFC
jgi:hypothetical protein